MDSRQGVGKAGFYGFCNMIEIWNLMRYLSG
jgi:hypothetical protein